MYWISGPFLIYGTRLDIRFRLPNIQVKHCFKLITVERIKTTTTYYIGVFNVHFTTFIASLPLTLKAEIFDSDLGDIFKNVENLF